MSNTFLSVSTIAQEALPLLAEQMAMLPLVHRGFDREFGSPRQKGDTIQIDKPQNFSTVDGSGDISGLFEDITEESVDLTLNFQRSVPIKIKAKDLTLSVKDFTTKFTQGAIVALGEYANQAILGLYIDIPYFYGASGTTPDALSDISQPRKIMQDNKAPADMRNFVMDNAAEAKFLELDSLVEVDKAGTNAALRKAAIGRVYNMGLFSDGQVKTHTAGLYSALADVTITTGAAAATSIVLTSAGGASTATLLKGDIFNLDSKQYVVTADTAAAIAGVVTVAIYPALPVAFGAMTSVAVTFADVSAGAHVANLMFQKNAFALGMAALAAPIGGAKGSVMSALGMSIRVVMDYDVNNDNNILRYDILFGVKTLFPELAVRVLG